MALIGALLGLSFLLNLALFSVSPKASFFLLPPRGWELGVGGMVALFELETPLAQWLTQGRRALCAGVGLVMILASIVLLSDATPFPGYAALLPVMGAAGVVLGGIGGRNPAAPLLAHPVVVHVGLISYPLYLWHWPLIAFCHVRHIHPAAPSSAFAILTLSFVLAED